MSIPGDASVIARIRLSRGFDAQRGLSLVLFDFDVFSRSEDISILQPLEFKGRSSFLNITENGNFLVGGRREDRIGTRNNRSS